MKALFIASLMSIAIGASLACYPSTKADGASSAPPSYIVRNNHYTLHREIDYRLCNACYMTDSKISCVHLPLDVCTPTK